MPYIDLRIEFSEKLEEYGDDFYSSYTPVRVVPIGSDIAEDKLDGIAEEGGQTDFYQVDLCNALLSALDGKTVVDLE